MQTWWRKSFANRVWWKASRGSSAQVGKTFPLQACFGDDPFIYPSLSVMGLSAFENAFVVDSFRRKSDLEPMYFSVFLQHVCFSVESQPGYNDENTVTKSCHHLP